jgi:transposase
LLATVRQAPANFAVARARWRLADLRQVVDWARGYSLAGLSQALRRLKVSRQRGRLRLHSPDPAYQAKVAFLDRVCTCALRSARAVVALYGDEMSLYRQPTLAPVYAPRGGDLVADLSQRSNTRYRVSGALDLARGQVTWLAASVLGVDNLCRFLQRVRAAYPTQQVVLIWDNWPVHQHPTVLARAAELEIGLVWLPTYAPWLHPIEKLWRWLKQDVLHQHRLADAWPALKAQVAAFLDRFAGPAPALLRYVGLAPEPPPAPRRPRPTCQPIGRLSC